MSKLKLDDSTVKQIISALRKLSLIHPSRSICLKKNRKRVLMGESKSGKPLYKLHWKCNKCMKWFNNVKDLEVDHIEEVGPFNGDLNEYAERLLCSPDNLQTLCVVCHAKKTSNYNATLRFKRK